MKHENIDEHSVILVSTVTICVSVSGFASLLAIPVGIQSSVVGLKICTITAEIEKYKSIIENKKRKHDKIVLLANSKLKQHASLNF